MKTYVPNTETLATDEMPISALGNGDIFPIDRGTGAVPSTAAWELSGENLSWGGGPSPR